MNTSATLSAGNKQWTIKRLIRKMCLSLYTKVMQQMQYISIQM